MNAALINQLEEILYDGLIQLNSPQERLEFLDQTCQGNPELRSRLEYLISVREEAERFFQTERAAATQVLDWADDIGPSIEGQFKEGLGTRIGRYRLVKRLGEGGCGVVYHAEQVEPVKRRVALKIIRVGLDSDSLIARFEMERQALALMDHPNIARVLDAGTTVSGRPFFVMEMVDGLPITTFCDQQRLNPVERLRLFIPVCMAIQHAHQKGIIHCDIKPANVMVSMHDGIAIPRVIDFGIARVTEGGQSDLLSPSSSPLLGTPVYMSPEQVDGNGLTVDTRSDVYSVGALLYELIAGVPPYDPESLRDADLEQIRCLLRELEVVRPSERFHAIPPDQACAIAASRRTQPEALYQTLCGDLDAIIMKAMSPERQNRYSAVSELAADLSRHLNHEAVNARSDAGKMYLLKKWTHRNKVIFVASIVAISGLILGFGTSTYLLFRESKALQEQARLRDAAEMARLNEARLRAKAEASEKVAHAAVLISHDRTADADKLLSQIRIENVPSSLESANTFRVIGEWLMCEGRMNDASRCFAAVAQAISRVDKSESEAISLHFLAAAAAVVDAADFEHYEELRNMAADRFATAADPSICDEVVKTCLVLPASPEIIARIEPLVKVLKAHLPEDRQDDPNERMEPWQMLSVCLASYRKDDFIRAEEWAHRCLRHPNICESRSAAAHAILSMSLYRMGKASEAGDELDVASGMVTDYFKEPIRKETQWTYTGYWFDWMIARTFVKEADYMIR